MMMFRTFVVLSIWATSIAAAPLAAPTVKLDAATVTGTSSGRLSKFLGIPFAQPPTGDLRFRLPQPIPAYTGNFAATKYGLSCTQQSLSLPILTGLAAEAVDYIVNSIFGLIVPDSEDCLTINVIAPATATPKSKLPVIVWMFGGGYELGGTAMYDGGVIADRSITLGIPAIYVSMNYRLTGFGFLGGKEVKEAGVGNLGLQDQREALRWIQKYIGAFGGDPTKVTIWGESAGAISVGLHMVANNGDNEGLFRAGFMQSGSPIPVGDITNGQKYYDAIVSQTGCSGSADTLDCLRKVPYNTLKAAVNKSPGIFSYQSLDIAWLPRADGKFLTDNPQQLVLDGKVANIPFITGDCDDEGTLFSLSTLNVTTDAKFRDYLKTYFLRQVPDADIDKLLKLYPSDITAGSPYDTGVLNALTPQFKRMASFFGDGVHASDILNVYAGGGMADYLIRFAANLDPNAKTGLQWPKYTTQTRKLFTFTDGLLIGGQITEDTFRKDAMAHLTKITLEHPL
ncbi:hypothetical protein H0H81_004727 [Sphagnurus paluster]|uniref:Carboxylic ester hydrolase n=1 Tax=Sphagnurus paluster TaxID=117069 RepID=A0A9P7GQB0_9AGAR|nr:hypothetical protein H0H81_004727 [Sphagnurus paluster]